MNWHKEAKGILLSTINPSLLNLREQKKGSSEQRSFNTIKYLLEVFLSKKIQRAGWSKIVKSQKGKTELPGAVSGLVERSMRQKVPSYPNNFSKDSSTLNLGT